MSENYLNRRAFIRIGASGLGGLMLNWPSVVNASGYLNYSTLQQFNLKVPEWIVYNDGSFDLITDSIMLKGCRPSIDGQAIMSKNVFLGDSPKGKRIVYELRNGFLMVDLKINDDSASISAELSGFEQTPDWFYPISHAKIENADSFYKQSISFNEQSGVYPLVEDKLPTTTKILEKGNWSHDSYMTFALFNNKDTLAVGSFEHRDFLHRSTVYGRLHQQEMLKLEPESQHLYFESGFLMEKIPLTNDFIKLPDIHFIFGDRPYNTLHHLTWEIGRISEARNGLCTCYHWSQQDNPSKVFSYRELKEQLDYLKGLKPKLPIQSVQIDDGYCVHGDWLEANENWPGGLDRAAREIYQYGFKAGITISPFKVNENSDLFRKHPDWLVKGHKNRPIAQMYSPGGNQYILDATHPGAQNYIRKVFRTLRKNGFTYYKTDHMDWGFRDTSMMKRANPRLTSLQIFRNIMAIIREEMGIGSFWLCNDSPFPSSIGYADGMRISNEGQLSWLDNSVPKIINEYYLGHYYNNVFWQNDPGVISINEKNSILTNDEKMSLALWNGIMGGVISTADMTDSWSEDKMKLFRFLEPSDRPSNAHLPFWPSTDEIKVAVRQYNSLDSWGVLFFNDKNVSINKSYDLQDITADERMHIFSWSPNGSEYINKKNKVDVELEPHQSVLFYISRNNTPPPDGLTLGGMMPDESAAQLKK